MTDTPRVTRIGGGVYHVEIDGCIHIVYVAGSREDRWLHWNGRVYQRPFRDERPAAARPRAVDSHQALSAPMPATVLSINVAAGSAVRKGDTLLVLEAMKMELPVRAMSDAVVRAVLCREGELVQPGALLVELE